MSLPPPPQGTHGTCLLGPLKGHVPAARWEPGAQAYFQRQEVVTPGHTRVVIKPTSMHLDCQAGSAGRTAFRLVCTPSRHTKGRRALGRETGSLPGEVGLRRPLCTALHCTVPGGPCCEQGSSGPIADPLTRACLSTGSAVGEARREGVVRTSVVTVHD